MLMLSLVILLYIYIYGHFMPRYEGTWQPSSRRIFTSKSGRDPIFDISKTVLKVHQSPEQKNPFYHGVDPSPPSPISSSPKDRLGSAFSKVVSLLYVTLWSRELHHWLALASPVSERSYMSGWKPG